MTEASGDIPIACSLPDAERRARQATVLAQFKAVVIAGEELPDGYAFRLSADRKSVAAAGELIASERECCPFLTFNLTVQAQSGSIMLCMTGPPGAKEFLRVLFCEE
jgi:hypothetical protein